METRPRLRASYDRLEEWEIKLKTPGCKASGLHIHHNTATIYGYLHLHLIHARIQEFLLGGGGSRPDSQKTALTMFLCVLGPQLTLQFYSGLSMVYLKENYNFPRFQRGSRGGPTFSRGGGGV